MNDDFRPHEWDDPDATLDAAVRAVLSEPLANESIERVTERADALATAVSAQRPSPVPSVRDWKSSRRFAGGAAAAAMLALVVVGALLLFAPAGSKAFAQMIANVRAASTVQFLGTYKDPNLVSSGRTYLSGNRARSQLSDGSKIFISDVDSRDLMVLDLKHKTYQRGRYSDESARQMADPISRLQQLKSKNAHLVGEEILGGRRTQIYRIEQVDLMGLGRNDAETMVWIDAESDLPAQLVVTDAKTKLGVRFEDFVWNEPLDAGLFSLEAPADFEDVMADPGDKAVQEDR